MLGLLGHLPVLIVRLSAFIVAVAMMVDAVCSLASWRRLSDQLERVRADLADRINESLADASDSMLERIPDSTIDSVAQTHIHSRAVNAWLAELGDAALDALREKASMPTFISDGARGLALAARRVADAAPSMPRPSLSRRLAGKRMGRPVPSVSLSRRDLRFFNAFPRLRINRYEGVIRATDLRDRAASCSAASQSGAKRALLVRTFPVRFAPVAAPFPRLRHRFHSTTRRLTTSYLVYTSCPSAALWAPTTFIRPRGSECTIRDRQRLCSSAPRSCF